MTAIQESLNQELEKYNAERLPKRHLYQQQMHKVETMTKTRLNELLKQTKSRDQVEEQDQRQESEPKTTSTDNTIISDTLKQTNNESKTTTISKILSGTSESVTPEQQQGNLSRDDSKVEKYVELTRSDEETEVDYDAPHCSSTPILAKSARMVRADTNVRGF